MAERQNKQAPFISSEKSLPEITLKALILAVLLTTLLGASNAYLALKLGQTIAASIPAAVISMGVLRFFKKYNVLENNIVQTAASAGEGVASAISFVLPALIITGYWQSFHYLSTALIALIGGILGVLFSIPLRRVMLNYPTLQFPEGTAIGNVLKASAKGTTKMRYLFQGGTVGAFISLFQTGFHIISDNIKLWFVKANTLFGMSFGFSPALLAAGFIVGPQACMGMFLGLFTIWVLGMPVLSHVYGLSGSSPFDMAMNLWSHHIRFIGVGTMLLGGAWTLLRLLKPIVQGVLTSFRSLRAPLERKNIIRTERDIPIQYVISGVVLFILFACGLFWYFLHFAHQPLTVGTQLSIVFISSIYLLIGGFFTAAVCGYFCGLVGATNNPLSGLTLGTIVLVGVILLPFLKELVEIGQSQNAVAYVIIVATMVAVSSCISGDNLQDLKAGQMVGATPWKQQVMLIVGVMIAALVVAPVLELLFQAYGMGGVFPRAGMDPSQMLPAPQAGLMTTIAQAVLGHHLKWAEILIGMLIAVIVIAVDETLKSRGIRLPVLAVGLGIYLPPEIITPTVLGGFMKLWVKRTLNRYFIRGAQETKIHQASENSILVACGMVAGASLMGVLLAIPFVIKGNADALALVSENFIPIANILGLVVIVSLCIWLFKVSTSLPR